MPDYPLLIPAFDRLELPGDIRTLIAGHHSEAHRHYHTLRHIDLMLSQIPTSHAFAPEMIAATLFHDIVYDPTRADNEEKSQAMFDTVAGRIEPLDRSLVSAMIMATQSHRFRKVWAVEDEAVNVLLKADLSILWHPDADVYAWYAVGVRKEYGFVPEPRFVEARANILTGLRDDLLDSGHLAAVEAAMLVRNVGWELGRLL